jgi:hypothetical protein
MSSRRIFAALAAAGCLWPAGVRAAEPAWTLQSALGQPKGLKLSGSIRARYEALEGQPRPGLSARADSYNFRTTLAAEYRSGPLRVGAEMFDSRVYGAGPRIGLGSNEVNALELVQAYVAAELKAPFGEGSTGSVVAGRMIVNLGSRRLVAADEFRNTTNSYTGVRFDTKTAGGTTATVIFTAPQLRLPDDTPSLLRNKPGWDRESFDLLLWGGIALTPKLFGKADGEIAFFGLDEKDSSDRATRDRRLRTVSARLIRNPAPGHFDFELEGGYQFGTVSADTRAGAPRLDVSAYFVHADAGYQFDAPWRPRLSVDYDYASGDDAKGTFRRFDTLLGMRRPDFTPSGILAAIGRANIMSPGLRLEATPSPRLDGFVSFRPMWLASATDSFSTTNVRDATGRSGRHAGEMLEGRVRYWLVPGALRLEANASLIAKGRFLKTAPNAPRTGDVHYLATSIAWTF